jgi:hypothetical protein
MFGQLLDDWFDRLWLWFVDVPEDLLVVVDDPLLAACAIAAPPTPRIPRTVTVVRASRSRFRMSLTSFRSPSFAGCPDE